MTSKKILNEISKRIKPQMIAKLIKISRIYGTPITKEQLKTNGHCGNNLEDDAEYLNRFMILWDLEVSRRLQRGKKSVELDELPVGVGIARIEQLVSTSDDATYEKYLTNPSEKSENQENQDVKYFNPFVGSFNERKKALKNIYSAVKPLCGRGREKQYIYNLNIEPKERHSNNPNKEGEKQPSNKNSNKSNMRFKEWEEKNQDLILAVTTERFHQELLREYGGDRESDGDQYSDEDEL